MGIPPGRFLTSAEPVGMKYKLIPVLVTALCFSPPPLHGQIRTNDRGTKVEPKIAGAAASSARNRDAWQGRAQAAFERAVGLGEKQTAPDLAAAIGAFEHSARLFESADANE